MANARLVLIDAKERTYAVYEGRSRVDKIKSEFLLDAEFVEYFRVHTDKVMADIEDSSA
jgi:hypothetical protein